jgi:DNA-binding transcriptional MerR regulator
MTEIKGEMPSGGAYRREDVRRMVDVSERQLRAWEKQGLIANRDVFGFSDLLSLKTLKRLRELHVAPRRIQQAIKSLRSRLADIDQPLAQLRITVENGKITVHVAGSRMEPVTGQLLLDFDAKELEKLRSFPVKPEPKDETNLQLSEHWFQKGLALEETGAPVNDAVAAYRKAIESNPHASGALVNLGTIAFRMRKLREAADYYNRAMEADPTYPLAHFNLGNLNDEQGNVEIARKHYLEAIRLNPKYADAYFNLALLCERNNDLLQAIANWQMYLKLDSTTSWASTARKQLDRLKRSVRSK